MDSLSSGTVITPTLGSMVQKGKFAASALALLMALKSVDFPTFGNPTIPHFKPIKEGFYLMFLSFSGLDELCRIIMAAKIRTKSSIKRTSSVLTTE
jgi:hypothetical protein